MTLVVAQHGVAGFNLDQHYYSVVVDTLVLYDGECHYVNKITELFEDCYLAVAGDMGPNTVFSIIKRKRPTRYTPTWVHQAVSVPLHEQYRVFNTSNDSHDYAGVVLTPDGVFAFDSYGYTHQVDLPDPGDFYAIGSGSLYAKGFLDVQLPISTKFDWSKLFQRCHNRIASVGAQYTQVTLRHRGGST